MQSIYPGWPLFVLFYGLLAYGIWRFVRFVKRNGDTIDQTSRDVAEIKAMLRGREQSQSNHD